MLYNGQRIHIALSSTFQPSTSNIKVHVLWFQLEGAEYSTCDVELTYDNWSAEEVLKAVLPEDVPSVTGFSIIGHVAHLNLKAAHAPFKSVIGQNHLDKKYILDNTVCANLYRYGQN